MTLGSYFSFVRGFCQKMRTNQGSSWPDLRIDHCRNYYSSKPVVISRFWSYLQNGIKYCLLLDLFRPHPLHTHYRYGNIAIILRFSETTNRIFTVLPKALSNTVITLRHCPQRGYPTRNLWKEDTYYSPSRLRPSLTSEIVSFLTN